MKEIHDRKFKYFCAYFVLFYLDFYCGIKIK